MERSRARLYYRSLGLSNYLVTQYDILQGYLRGKKMFPMWSKELDRAFAVLSDPHLKSLYDLEGSRGLQTEWCDLRIQNIMRKLGNLWAKKPNNPTSTTIVRFDNKDGEIGAAEWLVKKAPWVSDAGACSSSNVDDKTTPENAVKVEPSLVILESSQLSSSTNPPRASKRSRSSLQVSACSLTQSPSRKKSSEKFCIYEDPKPSSLCNFKHVDTLPPAVTETCSKFAHANIVNTYHPHISLSISNDVSADSDEDKVSEVKLKPSNVEVCSEASHNKVSEVFEVKSNPSNSKTSSEIISNTPENKNHGETVKVAENTKLGLKQSVSEPKPETKAVSSDVLNLVCCESSDGVIKKQNEACLKSFNSNKRKVINKRKSNKVVPETEGIAWPKNFPSTAWKSNI